MWRWIFKAPLGLSLPSAFQNEIPSRVASAEVRPSPAALAAGRWAGTGSAKRAGRDTERSIAEGERQRRRLLAAATHRAGPLSSCPKTVYGSSRSGPARPEGYFETCSEQFMIRGALLGLPGEPLRRLRFQG